MGVFEIFLHKYLWMMICTSPTFFAVSVHVIPAQLSDYMFVLAQLSQVTESHIEIWATFIHVTIMAMLSFITSLLDEVLAYFEIVTEIASFTIWTFSFALIFLACLDLAFIVRMWTCLPLPALTMDEFFANSICGEFGSIVCLRRNSKCLIVHPRLKSTIVDLTSHHCSHCIIIHVGITIGVCHCFSYYL